MAPLDRSTNLVRISRIAFDRALTSMAQIPRMIGGRTWSVIAERSEWEPLGDGVEDLGADTESGDRSGEWTRGPRVDIA